MTLLPEPADGYIETEGVRLHYVDWGKPAAQAMLLLHGLQDCARSWDQFAAQMSFEYHVVALDHRGHGDSGPAPQSLYRPQDYVSDVEAAVDQLGLEGMVLIGHSSGGRNAITFAVRHPEVVARLVVIDIDPDAENPEFSAMLERYSSEPDEWESLEAVIERLRTRQPNSPDRMLEQQALCMTTELPKGRRVWKRDRALLAAYERPDLWKEWSRVTCPTLILRGRQSSLLTHEVAVRMRSAIPRARLAELEGGGHWFYQEAPGAFEATVRWFLNNPPL